MRCTSSISPRRAARGARRTDASAPGALSDARERCTARVAVLGAGSFGTALALLLARNGHSVSLWGRDGPHVRDLGRARENVRDLPGFRFPDGLTVGSDLTIAGAADVVVLAVPSAAFAATVAALAALDSVPSRLVWGTKGFDPQAPRLLSEVAHELLPAGTALAVLSGPTFAREIAADLPAAVTVAAADGADAAAAAALFHGPRFRAYASTDLVGVQVGGAVKNVLAIAAGVADGLGFGANTRAALVTRGLAELTRLGAALGGRTETFMGLAGLGDLVLTCTDDQSRNRRFGLAIAGGASAAAAQTDVGQVVEGARTARQVVAIAARLGVEMPICEQVEALVRGATTPTAAVTSLLARDPRSEDV